jgi:hypothetical protein
MANPTMVNRGVLMEKKLCLYVNVPFTPEQEEALLKCKSKEEKSNLIIKWREKYIEENQEGIIKDALKLPKNKASITPPEAPKAPKTPEAPKDEELEALKAEYKALYGKNLSPSVANNKEWIANKIAEKKAEAEKPVDTVDPT